MKRLLIILAFVLAGVTLCAQTITSVAAGGTWQTARTTINSNFDVTTDSLRYLKGATDLNYGFISTMNDSIIAHNSRILARLRIADTTLMLTPYIIRGDTATMLSTYAKTSALASYLALTDTANMLSKYARISLLTSTYAPIANPQFTGTVRLGTDTIPTRPWVRDYVSTHGGGGGGSMIYPGAGIPLSTGSSWGTSITNNSANWNTAYGWGNHASAGYMTSGATATMINDSLTAAIAGAEAGLALADSNVVHQGYPTMTWVNQQLSSFSGGWDSAYIHYRVDSLVTVVEGLNQVLEDIYTAMGNIGVDIKAPTIDSLEIGNFADDVIQVWWSEPMITHGDSIPAATVWGLTEDSNAFGITGYSFVNDTVMRIGLDSVAEYGKVYALSYTRATPFLTDKALNPVANFTGRAVSNNVEEPEEPATFAISSTGDGSAVTGIRIYTDENITITLVGGSAKFYTDAAGTEGESTTWEVTSGAERQIYMKCTGAASTMEFSNIDAVERFGWGVNTSWGYINPTNGPVMIGDFNQFSESNFEKVIMFGNYDAGDGFDLTNYTSMTHLQALRSRGSINGLTSLAYISTATPHSVTGDLSNLLVNCRYIIIDALHPNYNNNVTYTTTLWPSNMSRVNITNGSGNGWSVNTITQAIIDASGTNWVYVTSPPTISFTTNHANMADTNQGGIWGNFSGEPAPSALAVAYKNLRVTQEVTVNLNGIIAPGETGDGTGFPTGFGDWYRSANPNK